MCIMGVSFTQAVALETETFSVCLRAVPITQEVALEIYDRRLSHCDLLHWHLLRRTPWSYMTEDFITLSYCRVICSGGCRTGDCCAATLSLCLIAWAVNEADAVKIYDQRLAHGVLW